MERIKLWGSGWTTEGTLRGGTLLAIAALGIFLCACQPTDPLLATWKIVRVRYESSGRATPESIERGQQIQDMSSGLQNSTFALYQDQRSAFFSTKTPYRQGTWSRDGDRLELQLGETGATYAFDILDQNETTLTLVLLATRMTEGELILTCQKSTQYTYKNTDLLSSVANAWRARPTRKETDAEIKLRAMQHLDYLIQYFKCVQENKQTYFETGLISSPFVFYAHGLGISHDNRYAERWQEAFFDNENARLGLDYLRKALRSVKKYPRAPTFTEEYLLAFQEMRTYFDQ